MVRKIIHIDMDCFYAAVEMRDNPALRNIPIAIGGSSKRGVVATCNYPAREFGVRSAMPVAQALRLCPDLILVKGRMSVYQQVSRQIRDIFLRYTDLIEPLSLDEAYLDVTDSTHCRGSATLIAEQIRRDIVNELQLTASAGVAPCKFLAKIASDENKPNGIFVIKPDQVMDFTATLNLKKIPGVGPKTLQRLHHYGLKTGADVRHYSKAELQQWFGKFGASLYERCHGNDNRPVTVERLRKSLGIETTLPEDVDGETACLEIIDGLLPKFEQRLQRAEQLPICRQGVKVKFADFTQTTVDLSCQQLTPELFPSLLREALARGAGKPVRLLGLHVGFSAPQKEQQLSLNL
ncbi:DNA polymerase IV [Thalassotalea mangrovi]|uniref:DNA polymerase IV n=1 Tax=Thalassotalea mangrovi TaxID=2572245 RepID=A0A4U1B4C4_9GAMM|nr:DNA polymerase IV [Thalassotalea mangrovi]TKB44536.1 DNA polymerase IV [Thalassotalea mangrovi]